MLDDVLPVIERPKESRQFMAVALANPWVAQDERMATKFMERPPCGRAARAGLEWR